MNRRRFLALAGGVALVPIVPAAAAAAPETVKWSRARIAIPAVQAENLRMLQQFQEANLYSRCLDEMLRAVAPGIGVSYEQLTADVDALRSGWHTDQVRE